MIFHGNLIRNIETIIIKEANLAIIIILRNNEYTYNIRYHLALIVIY